MRLVTPEVSIPSEVLSDVYDIFKVPPRAFPPDPSPSPASLLTPPPRPLCRRSTSSACTGATAARRRQPRRRRGTTAARAAPTWSGSTGWTGPSSRACTGCWRRGPAAPTSTLTRWPTAPSPCWTRTAATWSPSGSLPAGWVGRTEEGGGAAALGWFWVQLKIWLVVQLFSSSKSGYNLTFAARIRVTSQWAPSTTWWTGNAVVSLFILPEHKLYFLYLTKNKVCFFNVFFVSDPFRELTWF